MTYLFIVVGNLSCQSRHVKVNIYSKEVGDGGDSVVLVGEEKEEEELDESYFCCSYWWKHFWVNIY